MRTKTPLGRDNNYDEAICFLHTYKFHISRFHRSYASTKIPTAPANPASAPSCQDSIHSWCHTQTAADFANFTTLSSAASQGSSPLSSLPTVRF